MIEHKQQRATHVLQAYWSSSNVYFRDQPESHSVWRWIWICVQRVSIILDLGIRWSDYIHSYSDPLVLQRVKLREENVEETYWLLGDSDNVQPEIVKVVEPSDPIRNIPDIPLWYQGWSYLGSKIGDYCKNVCITCLLFSMFYLLLVLNSIFDLRGLVLYVA